MNNSTAPQTVILEVPAEHKHVGVIKKFIREHGGNFEHINPAITDENFAGCSAPMSAGGHILAILHCAKQYEEIKNDPTFQRINYGMQGLLIFWEKSKNTIPMGCASIISYGTEPWIDSCGALREPCIKLPWESTEDENPRIKPELALWYSDQKMPENYWVLSFLKNTPLPSIR